MSRKKTNTGKASSIGKQIIEGLTDFRNALRDGAEIEECFTVRTVELDLEPQHYTPDDVRRVRDELHASQAVFAKLLGVSPKTVRAWEQGERTPNPMARRFLDEIDVDRERWLSRLRESTVKT